MAYMIDDIVIFCKLVLIPFAYYCLAIRALRLEITSTFFIIISIFLLMTLQLSGEIYAVSI